MNSSWLMDAGIFVVSFGTAFYVLGRLGRKQAAKAVKKADTKVRSAAEEREAARKSADLTIRQLGNEKLAVITGDLTTFTEIFSKIENLDFEAGSRAAEMADFVPGGDENRRLQAGIARIRRLERNDDPDLRGLRIRALGVSDAETLFERASGKNEISYSSSINATVKWLMTGKVEGDVFGPDANNSVFVGFGDGPSHTRGEEKHRASARRCIRRKRNSSKRNPRSLPASLSSSALWRRVRGRCWKATRRISMPVSKR